MVKFVVVERKKKMKRMLELPPPPAYQQPSPSFSFVDESFIDSLLENIDLIDSLSDNSHSEDSSRHRPKHRRFPLNRVLKCDIRRKYSQMLLNSMNSYDFSVIGSFIQEFVHPSVSFQQINTVFSCQLQGKDIIANFFGGWLLLSPDIVFRMKDVKLKQVSTREETELISTFEVTQTNVYKIKSHEFAASYYKCHEKNSGKYNCALIYHNEVQASEESKGAELLDNLDQEIKRPKRLEESNVTDEERTTIDEETFNAMDLHNPHCLEGLLPRVEVPVKVSMEFCLTLSMTANKEINKISLLTVLPPTKV